MNAEIVARYHGLIQAQAVQAAHGDGEAYADAYQQGILLLLEAMARFDAKRGALVNWVAQALVAIRGDSRRQAQAATLRLDDLLPEDSGDEPALPMADFEESDPAEMDWDDELFELSNHIFANTVKIVKDPLPQFVKDGDPNTSPWIVIPQPPTPLAGQPFSVYGDEPLTLAEPDLREREDEDERMEMRCEGWEDAILGIVAQVVDSTEAWEDRPEELEPIYPLPSEAQVKRDLDDFLAVLKDEGPYIHSRAYQVAFVYATLDGKGPAACKQAGYQAWLKAKQKAGLMHLMTQANATCQRLEREAKLPQMQKSLPGMRKAWKRAHDEARQAQEALDRLIS